MNWLRFAAKAGVHGAWNLAGRSRRAREGLRGRLVILTYHSFGDGWPKGLRHWLPVDRFERQLRYLKARFEVVSLAQGLTHLAEGRQPEKPWVAITIDDGFGDNYTHAFPLLRRYEVPATIFLATDFLDTGRPPWPTRIVSLLDHTKMRRLEYPFRARLGRLSERAGAVRRLMDLWGPLPPAERDQRVDELRRSLGAPAGDGPLPLTWAQVREMTNAGVAFGSHTVFHSRLHEVDPRLVAEELHDSKARIEGELQTPCVHFAYPDGKWGPDSRKAVAAAGYAAALTQDVGANGPNADSFALRRIEVPYHDPHSSFIYRTGVVAGLSMGRP